MLTDIVKGRTATQVAQLPKEELLEEIGIQLTPIRLKCAILGLGVLKVALHETPRHAPAGRVAGPRLWLSSTSRPSTSCRRAR